MSGPTWVLLRGLGRESGHWGDFAAQLAERVAPAPVVALDLPGTGRRRAERAPTRIAATVDACRVALRRAGVAPPYRLLALSLGGMVALDWSQRFADEIAGCLVINTSARALGAWHERLRPGCWAPLAGTLVARDARRAEAAVLRCTSADAARHAAVLDAWVAIRRERPVSRASVLRQLLAAARHHLPDRPPAVPLRLLCSRGDALVDPRCTHRLAARWQVPLAEHPHAGHDLPLDDPQWVVEQAVAMAASPR